MRKRNIMNLVSILFVGIIVLIILWVVVTNFILENKEVNFQNALKPVFLDSEKEWLATHKSTIFRVAHGSTTSLANFVDSTNGVTGLDYQVAEAIKKDLEIDIQFEILSTDEQTQKSVEAHTYDFYMGLPENDTLKQHLIFLPNYMEQPYACYTLRNEFQVDNIYDLYGLDIGVIEGDNIMTQIKTIYGDLNYKIETYKTQEALFKGLKEGQVYAVLTATKYNQYSESVKWAFDLNAIQSGISRMSINDEESLLAGILYKEMMYLADSGKLQEMHQASDEAFRAYILQASLSEEEKAWIKSNKKLTIGFSQNSKPYNELYNNSYTGIVGEYLSDIGNELGIQFVADTKLSTGLWQDLTERLRLGKIDLLASVSGRIESDYNADGLLISNAFSKSPFTIPYLEFEVVAIGNGNNNNIRSAHDLEGKKIVIMEGSPIGSILEIYYSQIKLSSASTYKELIRLLEADTTSYALLDSYEANDILDQVKSKGIGYKGKLNEQFYQQFEVSPKMMPLASILNKAIFVNDILPILNKYNSVELNYSKNKIILNRLIYVLVLVGTLILISIILRMYYVAKRKWKDEEASRAQEYVLQQYAQKERGEEAASIAFFEWYVQEDLVDANAFFFELLGALNPDVGHSLSSLYEIVAEHQRAFLEEKLSTIRMGLVDDIHMEVQILNEKSNKYLWLRFTLKAIEHENNGLPSKVIGMIQDITAIKERENALVHQERMASVERLASGIATDFNQMLGTIRGYVELLQKKYMEDNKHAYWCEQVLTTVQKGEDLTQGLLEYSRMSPIMQQTFNVHEVIEHVSQILQFSARPHHIITRQFAQKEVLIQADKKQIENMLMNLGENAINAMDSGGELTFKTDIVKLEVEELENLRLSGQPKLYIRIEISDTGVGFTPEQINQIFEPFYNTRKASGKNGLGLATVLGIVAAHKGAVDVKSILRQGTQIVIYLPMNYTDEE